MVVMVKDQFLYGTSKLICLFAGINNQAICQHPSLVYTWQQLCSCAPLFIITQPLSEH